MKALFFTLCLWFTIAFVTDAGAQTMGEKFKNVDWYLGSPLMYAYSSVPCFGQLGMYYAKGTRFLKFERCSLPANSVDRLRNTKWDGRVQGQGFSWHFTVFPSFMSAVNVYLAYQDESFDGTIRQGLTNQEGNVATLESDLLVHTKTWRGGVGYKMILNSGWTALFNFNAALLWRERTDERRNTTLSNGSLPSGDMENQLDVIVDEMHANHEIVPATLSLGYSF